MHLYVINGVYVLSQIGLNRQVDLYLFEVVDYIEIMTKLNCRFIEL